MFLSGLIQSFNQLKYCVDPPAYQSFGPHIDSSVTLVDAAQLLPPLPSGIPFVKLDKKESEKIDRKNSGLSLGVQKTREFLRYELKMCRSLEAWGLQNPNRNDHTTQDLLTIFENSLQNQFFFYLEKDKDGDGYTLNLQLPLNLQLADYREDSQPLGATLHFDATPNPKLLHLRSVTQRELQVSELSQLSQCLPQAMASVSTLIIMRTHFLYCHLLCGMTIYNLAWKFLTPQHPVFRMMYPHGYQTNVVNIGKGEPLLTHSFSKDFSFVPSGLRHLFQGWMKEYKIENLSFPALAKRLGLSCTKSTDPSEYTFCQPLLEGFRVYRVVEEYVRAWILACYPSPILVIKDKRMRTFYDKLSALPFRSTFGKLTRKNLMRLLTTWLYVHVYLHFEHGDEGADLMQYVQLRVPKPSTDPTVTLDRNVDSEVGKQFFYLIFTSVTKPTFLVNRHEWILDIPPKLQPAAREFQRKLGDIHARFELGINK
jgi:hypothetical protein